MILFVYPVFTQVSSFSEVRCIDAYHNAFSGHLNSLPLLCAFSFTTVNLSVSDIIYYSPIGLMQSGILYYFIHQSYHPQFNFAIFRLRCDWLIGQ